MFEFTHLLAAQAPRQWVRGDSTNHQWAGDLLEHFGRGGAVAGAQQFVTRAAQDGLTPREDGTEDS